MFSYIKRTWEIGGFLPLLLAPCKGFLVPRLIFTWAHCVALEYYREDDGELLNLLEEIKTLFSIDPNMVSELAYYTLKLTAIFVKYPKIPVMIKDLGVPFSDIEAETWIRRDS